MGSTYAGAFEDWEFAIARKISSEFLANHSWIKGLWLGRPDTGVPYPMAPRTPHLR